MRAQRTVNASKLRKTAFDWICPSCSLAISKRSLSSSSRKAISQHFSVFSQERRTQGFPVNDQPDSIVSLIQPTGTPHLGNYLGVLQRWKELEVEATKSTEKKSFLYFGLADLHSLTGTQSSHQLKGHVKETFAALLALGLGTVEPNGKNLFVQSQIPEHTELMWILSNVASTGYLSRMTQYKDKLRNLSNSNEDEDVEFSLEKQNDSSERLKLGLFSYPVLQAADILLYGATHVPVGEDQAQHVELTRHLARAFNSTYCRTLKEPKLMLSPAKRIMSLIDPTKKMSKSHTDKRSRILVTDSPETIRKKISAARTDSIEGAITYDLENRPGVSNLINILKYTTRSPLSQQELLAEVGDVSLGTFKNLVADAIIREFEGVREKFDMWMDDEKEIKTKMNLGNARARRRAIHGIVRVRKAVGLDYPSIEPRSSSVSPE